MQFRKFYNIYFEKLLFYHDIILHAVISIVCYTAALIIYHQIKSTHPFLVLFEKQVYFVIAASLLLSILWFIFRKTKIAILAFLLKFIFLIVVGYPFGGDLYFELCLTIPFIFDCLIFLEEPLSCIVVFFIAAVEMLFQREFIAWGRVVEAPEVIDHIFFGVILILTSITTFSWRHSSFAYNTCITQIEKLDSIVVHLSSVNKDFQQYAVEAREDAQMLERKRISRDIHDTVGYTLTNLIMMMEAATDFSKTDPDKTRELLQKAREQASLGLEDTRKSLRALRHIGDTKKSCIAAVNELVKTFQKATGVETTVEFGNIPWSFNPLYDSIMYSIIQEGLVNSFRHGHATRITIKFWQDLDSIKLAVNDNGKGSESIVQGIGLAGMKERLKLVDGTLSAGNSQMGFDLRVTLPNIFEG